MNSSIRKRRVSNTAIAFNKGGTGRDVTDYRTDANGNCSFRLIAGPGTFHVSFSYPYVDISDLTATRWRNGQTTTLGPDLVQRPQQSPSSLSLLHLQNNDVITIGDLPTNSPIIHLQTPLVYEETAVGPLTNGPFVSLAL